MSTFPSVISTISDPTATNRLNSPSHSSIEQAQNDGIEKLETFVGTLSSAVGTLMYDIRGAGSDGGGHVQGANKGGTGQTTFTKGDILVAQSSSVLSKLAVGANNDLLVADSSQDVGVKWTNTAVTRVATKHVSIDTANGNTAFQSVMSVNIPGSTLGTAGVIRATIPLETVKVGNINVGGGVVGSLDVNAQYGNSSVLITSILQQASVGAIMGDFLGECVVEIISASVVGSQRMILRGSFGQYNIRPYPSVAVFYKSSILAEESSSTLALTVSFRTNASTPASTIGVITNGYIVEKI